MRRNKSTAKQLIERYFRQLTDGCGNGNCNNESCASCSEFQPLDKNAAAVRALELFKTNARLCDPLPSEKESDSLHPGGAMASGTDLCPVAEDFSGACSPRRRVLKLCIFFPSRFYFAFLAADVHHLTENAVCAILSSCEEKGDYSPLVHVIGKVFSKSDALMKSFRKVPPGVAGTPDSGTPTEEDVHVGKAETSSDETSDEDFDDPDVSVDVDSVRRVYDKLGAIDQLEAALVSALVYLTPNLELDLDYLEVYERNPDYLNIFVIVMENSNLHSPEYLEAALPQFCKAMNKLPVPALARLCKLWSQYDVPHLRRMVETFQQLITFKVVSSEYDAEHLVNDDETVLAATQCLKVVFYASVLGGDVDVEHNEDDSDDSDSDELTFHELLGEERIYKKGPQVDALEKELGVRVIDSRRPLVPFEDFINESLNDVVEMDKDFTFFKVDAETQFSFQTCPFILSLVTKNQGLYYDNRIRMYSERRLTALYSMVQGSEPTPYLNLKVRRDHIIDDALVRVSRRRRPNPARARRVICSCLCCSWR